MMNRKIASGLILAVIIAFPVCAGAEEVGSAVPALESLLSCKASPAEPTADAQPGDEIQAVPSGDLFAPEPTYVCWTGWCSIDSQCVEWFGPGSTCIKKSGASCGQCS